MGRNRRALPAKNRSTDPKLHKHLKVWQNTSHRSVHDLEPGEVGELSLTDGEAKALREAGFLAPVDRDEDPLFEV